MQVTGDALERNLQTIERLFDPDAVPEGNAMRYLARWLCLNLEGT